MSNLVKPTTDPVADMLTRIRNSLLVGQQFVSLPSSAQKQQLAIILQKNGYIKAYKLSKDAQPQLQLQLFADGQNPAISALKRISKPGRRVYVSAQKVPLSQGGKGLIVISTSAGMLSGHEARMRKLGGEVVCEVN